MKSTLLAVTVALFLTGCGGGSDDPNVRSGSTASSTPSKTTPVAPRYKILGESDLEDALLGVQDLPTGFSQDAEATPETGKTYCDYKAVKEEDKVTRDFTKGGGMSTEAATLILRQYKDSATAKRAFDALSKTIETCRDDSIDGSAAKHSVMGAPKVGEASIGIRTDVEGATALSNFALVGPVMVNAGMIGLTSTDADEAAQLLVKQVDAYAAAAKN